MADFQPAFDYMLAHEDPRRTGVITRDAGGLTRFGIAQKYHPDLPAQFYDEKTDLAQVFDLARSLYESRYWSPMGLKGIADQGVASKLLDMAVNLGVPEAAFLAQEDIDVLLRVQVAARMAQSAAKAHGRSLVEADGVCGPQTIAALNACAPADLEVTLCDMAKIHYYDVVRKNPHQRCYLDGWLKRADCRPDRLCDEHGLAQHAKAGGQ